MAAVSIGGTYSSVLCLPRIITMAHLTTTREACRS